MSLQTAEPLLLTVRQAAQLLGVRDKRVRSLIRDGELAPVRIDQRTRVERSSVLELIERRRVLTAATP